MSLLKLQLAIGQIVDLSKRDRKNAYGFTNHLTSEVGEFCTGVETEMGDNNKTHQEPLSGELADVVQCAIAAYCKVYPGLTAEAVLNSLADALITKNAKWAKAKTIGPVTVPKQTLAQVISSQLPVIDLRKTSDVLAGIGVVPGLGAARKVAAKAAPNLPKLHVLIRKHPAGIKQPLGERRIVRMDTTSKPGRVFVGINDGKQGWDLDLAKQTPSFLTFRTGGLKNANTLQQAVAWWNSQGGPRA